MSDCSCSTMMISHNIESREHGENIVLNKEIALIKKWNDMSSEYHWLHKQAFLRYKIINNLFMISITLLTTVSGSMDILFSNIETCVGNDINYIQFGSGCMVVLAAILTTIYNFLSVAETQQSHLNSKVEFEKLSRTIEMEMVLLNTDKRRYATLEEFIKAVRSDIDHLMEQSPPIPESILNALYRKFDMKKCLSQKKAEIEFNIICTNEQNTQDTVKVDDEKTTTISTLLNGKNSIEDIIDIENIKKVVQNEKLNNFLNRMKK